jgi:hypothetical protein
MQYQLKNFARIIFGKNAKINTFVLCLLYFHDILCGLDMSGHRKIKSFF